MVLITRCPACATAFRVDETQLRLRQGWVRCGVCNEVFDARSDLSEQSETTLLAPSTDASAEAVTGSDDATELPRQASAPLDALPVPLLYDDEPGLPPARPVNVERLAQDAAAAALHRQARGALQRRSEPSLDLSRLAVPTAPILIEPQSAAKTTTPPPLPSVVSPPAPSAKPEAEAASVDDTAEPLWKKDPIATPVMQLAQAMPERASFFNEPGHAPVFLKPERVVTESVWLTPGTDPLLGTPLDEHHEQQERSRASGSRWPWTLGVIVALLALIFQFAYVFRAQIATHIPETRPYLQQLCDWMQCEVGHLTDAALLSIESSSIEPWYAGTAMSASRALVQAGGETPAEVEFDVSRRLALRVSLRNRAPFDQPWPAMELSLTDTSEQVVARRILPPALYLAPESAPDMMGAGSLHVLRVPIDTTAPRASGYRVLFFYP